MIPFLALLGWLLLAGPARAADPIPVVLPPGESTEAWRRPLALAGLRAGEAEGTRWIELASDDGHWVLRLHDRSVTSEVAVKVPRTQQDREDIAWVAQSLMRTMPGEDIESAPLTVADDPAFSLPPVPPPVPVPLPEESSELPVVAEAPTEVPQPEPAPEPEPDQEEDLDPVAEAPFEPPEPMTLEPGSIEPPPTAPIILEDPQDTVMLVMRLGAGVGARSGIAPAAPLRVALGASGPYGITLSFETVFRPRADLADLSADRAVSTYDVLGMINWWEWWQPDGRISPVLGVGGGWSIRRFFQDGERVAAHSMPLALGEGGVSVRMTRWLAVQGTLRTQFDLQGTLVRTEGSQDETEISPFEIGGGGISVVMGL